MASLNSDGLTMGAGKLSYIINMNTSDTYLIMGKKSVSIRQEDSSMGSTYTLPAIDVGIMKSLISSRNNFPGPTKIYLPSGGIYVWGATYTSSPMIGGKKEVKGAEELSSLSNVSSGGSAIIDVFDITSKLWITYYRVE